MNKEHVDNAKNLITSLEETAKANKLLQPFCNQIISTLKALMDDCVTCEKETMFAKAHNDSLEKKLKPLLAKETLIRTCFGDEVAKFLELASESVVRRFDTK